jgi:hypothetical protein
VIAFEIVENKREKKKENIEIVLLIDVERLWCAKQSEDQNLIFLQSSLSVFVRNNRFLQNLVVFHFLC